MSPLRSVPQPLQESTAPMTRAALVVGGGIAGIQAATDLAVQGFPVTLVEKQGRLGGMLNDLTRVYPANLSAFELARTLVEKIKSSRVEAMVSAEENSTRRSSWPPRGSATVPGRRSRL